ncbi:MAG: hypothetical protein E7319_11085 [Clostridiales bacterium]|nr:hypothetical protein [Clostridiales bacterium]
MKQTISLLLIIALLLGCTPAFAAEKRTDCPELFHATVEFTERKEEDNQYYISKEYLNTANDQVNQILRQRTDDFDVALRPLMEPCEDNNAKRNSRLDIETVYTFTGDTWISTMVIARYTYQRIQRDAPFVTGTYDLLTGEEILLTDIFPEDSPAWDLLTERVESHVNTLFPEDPRNPDAIAQLTDPDALRSASFTLSAMELTLHYPAKLVYPDRTGLMHVRFFYDELWDMMTDEARVQTDNTDWKMVALTCDDGPNYSRSPAALTAFRRAGVRVTYFTEGAHIEMNPDMLMRQFDQNHIIASHSFTHSSGYALSEESRLREIERHNEQTLRYIGEPAALFRAPGGTYPPWIEAGIGLPLIQWSVDTYDYTGKDQNRIFYSIRNNVQDGDVILMHDTGDYLYKAVPIFTEYLWENGYMMVTVPELARANGITLEPDTVYFRFFEGQTDKREDSNI